MWSFIGKIRIYYLLLAPRNELAQAFGNHCNVEFLLGPFLPSCLDTTLDEAQLRRIHVLIVAQDFHWLASYCCKVTWLTVLVHKNNNRLQAGINLIIH